MNINSNKSIVFAESPSATDGLTELLEELINAMNEYYCQELSTKKKNL